jgi:hypothetical protein
MDDINDDDDDWTKSDETFDYNKKIDRYRRFQLRPRVDFTNLARTNF